MENLQRERIHFADMVRVFATLAVIFIHSSGEIVERFNQTDWSHWWTCNIINSLTRWCVPLFVMLSGALLLPATKTESLKAFFSRRFKRVFVPFLFWVCVYVAYTYRGNLYYGKNLPWPDIAHQFFLSDIYFHLWFINMILGLYLLTPVFRVFVKHADRVVIEYFLVMWFVLVSLATYYPTFFFIKYMGWLGYIGLFVAGYYLTHFKLPYRRVFYVLGWISLLVTAPGTWYFSVLKNGFSDKLYIYLAPTTLLTSVALFHYCVHSERLRWFLRRRWVYRAIHWFSTISFGVYLVHALILDLLKNGYLFGFRMYSDHVMGYPLHPAVGVPLLVLAVVSISSLIISIFHRIPLLKDVSG